MMDTYVLHVSESLLFLVESMRGADVVLCSWFIVSELLFLFSQDHLQTLSPRFRCLSLWNVLINIIETSCVDKVCLSFQVLGH